MRDCARCSEGPQGLEGHLELTLFHEGQPPHGAAGRQHLFVCVACSARWERHYEGDGRFAWRRRAAAGN